MKSTVSTVLLGLVVYIAYHLSTMSSVPGGDAGELLSESCLLGTPHPPGYPTYTMLSYFFGNYFYSPRLTVTPSINTMIPFKVLVDYNPSWAWRINHMCSILGALTSMILHRIAILTVHSLCPLDETAEQGTAESDGSLETIGIFMFSFSHLVWEYSTTAEVFALNNLLCAASLYVACLLRHTVYRVLIRKQSTQETTSSDDAAIYRTMRRLLYLGAFLSGLSLSNQHTSLIQLVVLIPFALIQHQVLVHHLHHGMVTMSRSLRSLLAVVITSLLPFALGLLPYYYLHIVSFHPPAGSWGDMTTLTGFLRHVLRTEYGTFRLGSIQGSESGLQRIWAYGLFTSQEWYHLTYPLLGLGGLGVLGGWLGRVWWSHPSIGTSSSSSNPEDKRRTAQSFKTKRPPPPLSNKGVLTPPPPSKKGVLFRTADSTPSPPDWVPVQLIGFNWILYLVLWHYTLSNLPLSSPMPFAVHSRFWMQPNLCLYLLLSVAISQLLFTGFHPLFQWNHPSPWSTIPTAGQTLTSLAVAGLCVGWMLYDRFDINNRSIGPGLIHTYAWSLLDSIPMNHTSSLLVSHTDLNWNSVRYFQSCEGVRPDITQLSLQLVPYDWFQVRQGPVHYPHLRFPVMRDFVRQLPPGVVLSTDRSSEGNARLLTELLVLNGVRNLSIPDLSKRSDRAEEGGGGLDGMYVDMQSVNEVDIGMNGRYRNGLFYLIPWGCLYRVFGPQTSENQLIRLHGMSLTVLKKLQTSFPEINQKLIDRVPAGSWERASLNVFNDAHYQLGIHLLTFSIEYQRNINVTSFPLLIDRLTHAVQLLDIANQNVLKYQIISSSHFDVYKNEALSRIRLHAVLAVVDKFRDEILKFFYRQLQNKSFKKNVLDAKQLERVLKSKKFAESFVMKSVPVLQGFLESHPLDRDADTFRGVLDTMRMTLSPPISPQ